MITTSAVLCLSVGFIAAGIAAQSGKSSAKEMTETGWVVNLKNASFSISNIPAGGGAPAGGGGPMVFTRQSKAEGGSGAPAPGLPGKVRMQTPDGKVVTKRMEDLTPEERERINQAMKHGGANVQTKTVRPEDLTPEQRERMAKSGGKAMTFSGDDTVAPAPSNEPLKITDFVTNERTRRVGEIANGAKVKVTYVEQDGKKVATRIEVQK
ncbi:MAG TPA: hypothetical protein VGA40_09475 [Candidatus Acidoferrales bacterium]